MQRNGRNDHVLFEDRFGGLCQPVATRSHQIESVRMLQGQDEIARQALVEKCGAPTAPGARDHHAIIADFRATVVLTGKRCATTIADQSGYKRHFVPAGRAEPEVRRHMSTATHAGGWKNQMNRALQSLCHSLSSRMMNDPLVLIDRRALARNRARAKAGGVELFLHETAVAEIKERLGEVNRQFKAPLIVTAFPEIWRDVAAGARIISDENVLDAPPAGFDLVIHGMAMHWVNDPVGQLIQCQRALQPDGLFLAAFPGGRTLHELRACLAEAESLLSGGLSPRVLPMGEIRDLGALLMRAGFALPVADSLTVNASYKDLFHLVQDLRAMGETNALSARQRCFARRSLFAEAARQMSSAFPAEDGRIKTTFELMFLTGWAPHPSQQKPLKPGSAISRLADALGATDGLSPPPKLS